MVFDFRHIADIVPNIFGQRDEISVLLDAPFQLEVALCPIHGVEVSSPFAPPPERGSFGVPQNRRSLQTMKDGRKVLAIV